MTISLLSQFINLTVFTVLFGIDRDDDPISIVIMLPMLLSIQIHSCAPCCISVY